MGYMNYYLKDKEIIDRRCIIPSSLQVNSRDMNMKKYCCPYCNLMFSDKNNLYKHIKGQHNFFKYIVLLNNKIINSNNCAFVDTIEQLDIQLYDNKVDIIINNQTFTNINDKFYEIVYKEFELFNQASFSLNNDKYYIKKCTVDVIDYSKVNPIIDDWNIKVNKGLIIDKDYGNKINDVEKMYLDGFFNYFIACDSQGHNKGERYLSAYGILNNFNPIDPRGIFVLKIIAFRLNWIELLNSLCVEDDIFKIICNFYNEEKIIKSVNKNEKEIMFFVEDEIIESINSIINYINKDYVKVDNYINNISIYDLKDSNWLCQ